MTRIFLLRALDLLGKYIELTAKCHCTDKITRAELYSKVWNLLDDVIREDKDAST